LREVNPTVRLSLHAAFGVGIVVASAFGSPAMAAGRSVTFVENGSAVKYVTSAPTVEAFLRERKVTPAAGDFLSAPRDGALVDEMTLEYRTATTYHVLVDGTDSAVATAAENVADILKAAHVQLGPLDEVDPLPSSRPAADAPIRVTRVNAWDETVTKPLPRRTEQRFEPTVAPGQSRTADPGADGVMETTYHFVLREGKPVVRTLVGSKVVREPRARLIVRGMGEYEAFTQLAKAGISTSLSIAGTAMRMIATAYIPQCIGCSGTTKTGLRAGHGVVAVDPRVIPLGTKLYIPGYGHAVAGDIGSAINGKRIDLGFNHLGDALRFGRREITVYIVER
jgi:3D (Asp-Asp-Asp) domain-containing protein